MYDISEMVEIVLKESDDFLKVKEFAQLILDEEANAGQAYADAVKRLLGETVPHRFLEAEKKGFFKRLLGGK